MQRAVRSKSGRRHATHFPYYSLYEQWAPQCRLIRTAYCLPHYSLYYLTHYLPCYLPYHLPLAASTRYADLEAAAEADERIVAAAVAAAEAAAEATVAVVAATPATDAIVVAAAGGGAAPRTLGESLLATENLLLVGCAPPRTSPHP